ncbi:hypothetical protein KBC70_03320 [Candidatus Woesebacteria bacterium]|nr:hypothetical protein [Candidatus Woesebacteria bacterium]
MDVYTAGLIFLIGNCAIWLLRVISYYDGVLRFFTGIIGIALNVGFFTLAYPNDASRVAFLFAIVWGIIAILDMWELLQTDPHTSNT